MPRYAVTLEFAGRGFSGTAPQPGRRTLLETFRAALGRLGGDPRASRSCGRLDSGVDAAAFVIHCDLERAWVPRELGRALNAHLPQDAVVWRAAAVPRDWDARFAAAAKTYAYRVAVRGPRPVLEAHRLHLRELPHRPRLDACAAALVGEHDLTAFACRRADGSDPAEAVRRIEAAAWIEEPAVVGTTLAFRITGSGFLYKQVRGLVGAMLAVARGRTSLPAFIAAIGAGWDHPRLGAVAPARGLLLESVRYEPEPTWELL